jgi:hypothetical protein
VRVDLRRGALVAEVAEALDGLDLPVLGLDVAVPLRAAVADSFGTPIVLAEYEPLARAVLAMLAETTAVRA